MYAVAVLAIVSLSAGDLLHATDCNAETVRQATEASHHSEKSFFA
jgi:hypothetical protein